MQNILSSFVDTEGVVFPHRLAFVPERTCDVCKIDTVCRNIPFHNSTILYGWRICGDELCRMKILDWISRLTIKKEDVIPYFNNMVVRRSSGELEDNWEIYGDIYILDEDLIRWVPLRNKSLTHRKNVKLDMLLEWNNMR
jgi:hypothetical protein